MLPSVSPVRRSMSTRRDHLAVQHQVAEAGEVGLEHGLGLVAEAVALGVPVAAAQLVRRVLHEARHDVLAGWGHVGVDDRLDRGVDERPLGVPAVLRRVEGPLDVLDRRADVEEAAVVVDGVGQRREDRAGRRGRSSPWRRRRGTSSARRSRPGRRAARAGRRGRGRCAAGRARTPRPVRGARCRPRGRRRRRGRPSVSTDVTRGAESGSRRRTPRRRGRAPG